MFSLFKVGGKRESTLDLLQKQVFDEEKWVCWENELRLTRIMLLKGHSDQLLTVFIDHWIHTAQRQIFVGLLDFLALL